MVLLAHPPFYRSYLLDVYIRYIDTSSNNLKKPVIYLGISFSKKLKTNAVTRNKTRRRIREIFRKFMAEKISSSYQILVKVKALPKKDDFWVWKDEFDKIF